MKTPHSFPTIATFLRRKSKTGYASSSSTRRTGSLPTLCDSIRRELLCFRFCCPAGRRRRGSDEPGGQRSPSNHVFVTESGKITFKIWFVWLAKTWDACAELIYHCRVLRQPGLEVLQCRHSWAVCLHPVCHPDPDCQTLCTHILGSSVPVNKIIVYWKRQSWFSRCCCCCFVLTAVSWIRAEKTPQHRAVTLHRTIRYCCFGKTRSEVYTGIIIVD